MKHDGPLTEAEFEAVVFCLCLLGLGILIGWAGATL